MNSKIKYTLIVAIILAVGIFVGAKFFSHTRILAGASNITPVGATNLNQHQASISMSFASPTGTSTSIFNGDGSDRIVTQDFVTCTNLGTSFTAYTGTGLLSLGLNIQAATTSTANPAVISNTNDVLNVSIATTTPTDSFNATSTWSGEIPNQRWAAGSWMTFFSNATNTAQCTPVLEYINS